MRAIDADALMDILADRLIKVSERYGVDSAVAGAVSGAMKLVDAQPTIKPEHKTGRWIPCSKRLPEEKDAGILKKVGISTRSEEVIVTMDVDGDRMTEVAETQNGKWKSGNIQFFEAGKHVVSVVAWMDFPEPYKEV